MTRVLAALILGVLAGLMLGRRGGLGQAAPAPDPTESAGDGDWAMAPMDWSAWFDTHGRDWIEVKN